MADTYTAQGLIKPEPGGSLNTWGTKLNDNMIDVIVAMLGDGGVNCAAGGTISVSFTDGDDTATALPFLLKLTGSPAAAFTLQLPAVDKYWVIWNATGQSATVKISGGTGIALADSDIALVMYSAIAGDIINVSPNRLHGALTIAGQLHGVTAGTATTDAVNKAQLDAAIAAAGTLGDGTFFNSATDTTRKFLASSLTTQISGLVSVSVSTVNGGGNEQTKVAVSSDPIAGVLTGTITSGITAMSAGGLYRITGGTGTLPALSSGQAVLVQLVPAAGNTSTVGRNSQTIDGVAEDDTYSISAGPYPVVKYTGSGGAVKSELIGSVAS